MEKMKWLYTFFLMLLTLGWAIFSVMVVQNAMAEPTPASVLEASGTTVFLGALLAWNANVNQYWFRKKTPAAKPPTPTESTEEK